MLVNRLLLRYHSHCPLSLSLSLSLSHTHIFLSSFADSSPLLFYLQQFCGNDSDKTCPRKDVATQAFKEYYPGYDYADESDGIYYSFTAGKAKIIMLDTRSQRTPEAAEDNADKSMLGDKQKAWLKNELMTSTSKWNFVISTVTANTSARPTHMGHWGGFQTEGNELRAFLEDNDLNKNGKVIMITADLHTGGALDNGCNNRFDLPELGVPMTNLAKGNDDHTGTWSEVVHDGAPGYAVVEVGNTQVKLRLMSAAGKNIGEMVVSDTFDNGCDAAAFDDGKRCSYSYKAFNVNSPTEGDCADDMVRKQLYSGKFPHDLANNEYIENDMHFYQCNADAGKDNGYFIIESNNIPSHDAMREAVNPMCEKYFSYIIPMKPTVMPLGRRAEIGNVIGVGLDGVIALHGRESGGESAVEGNVKLDARAWYGHANVRNMWHYHSPAMGVDTANQEPWDENTLLGFAMDGFPIYGPLSDSDVDNELDECNFHKADQNRYHVRTAGQVDHTLDYCRGNFEAATNWNYIAGCFRGDVDSLSAIQDTKTWQKPGKCFQVDVATVLAASGNGTP